MPLDPLPSEIIAPTRDEWVTRRQRSYRLRQPNDDQRPGTQPYIDAVCLADQLAVISASSRQVGHSIPLAEVNGLRLDQRLDERGLPPRFPEVGASGYVTIGASVGGTTIFSGDELTETNTGTRIQCIATGLYLDGAAVPVACITTGPGTNLAAGTVLAWSGSRPGRETRCTITEQTDGTGFLGGRLAETDDEVRLRISNDMANPASAGNDAAYQREIENSRGHNVPVQKAFTFPADLGPGTIGAAFTLQATAPGASRIPSALQIAQVRDYVVGKFPADDQYIELILVSQPVTVLLDVQWATGAAAWADAAPWPARYATGAGGIVVASATSPVSFTLRTDNDDYTGVTSPVAGQTIALLDLSAGKFSRKRLLSVTGTGPWDCTVDVTNAASDTSYLPLVGQRVSPWSDSLDSIVGVVRDYFNSTGPGEQYGVFFDPGQCQKRNPPSPRYWPYVTSNRLAADLLDRNKVPAIQDSVIREGLGVTATVGTPGATCFLLELGELAAFKL
jgi:uncharacterized phage protein gp47/JayE